MIQTIGYAATLLNRTLKPKTFQRADPGPGDVVLDLLFCGICHSDVHQVNNDWNNTVWPCVPGHEIVGRVSQVGGEVKGFKVGDVAAVGCMVDSCGKCFSCLNGDEQYCESETSMLGTYNGPLNPTLQNTYGGYSNRFVVKEHFLLHVPDSIPIETVGPLLCAGVTTYSPLKHWGVKEGMKVGIVGLGGLGHMAVQIAKAMRAEVTVISTSDDKKEDAIKFGASKFVLSTSSEQMKETAKSLDFVLDTIPEKHEFEPYLDLLHRDGAMVIVGVLAEQPKWNPQKLLMQRKTVAGSLIGSIAETREVLDFCAQHKIAPKVEVVTPHGINEAYKNVEKKKARYRYVIDLSHLAKEDARGLPEIDAVSHVLDRDRKVVMPQPEVHTGKERQDFKPGWAEESLPS